MTAPNRILVAGGAGQLGRALGRQGCHALGRDHLDITDPTQIAATLEQTAPDILINAAAYTAVDAAEDDSDSAHLLNATGAGLLARLAAAAGIPLIHISTDMVFSHGDPARPLKETARPKPNSVYGESKLEGETQVRSAGGRHLVARVSWLFSQDGESFVSRMLELGSQRDSLKLVDDEYGRPTDVDALAGHLVRLATRLQQGEDLPSLLHLGPPSPVSRLGWAEQIFTASARAGGPAPSLSPVPSAAFQTPAERPVGVVLDVSRAEALLDPMPDWRLASDAAVEAWLSTHRPHRQT